MERHRIERIPRRKASPDRRKRKGMRRDTLASEASAEIISRKRIRSQSMNVKAEAIRNTNQAALLDVCSPAPEIVMGAVQSLRTSTNTIVSREMAKPPDEKSPPTLPVAAQVPGAVRNAFSGCRCRSCWQGAPDRRITHPNPPLVEARSEIRQLYVGPVASLSRRTQR